MRESGELESHVPLSMHLPNKGKWQNHFSRKLLYTQSNKLLLEKRTRECHDKSKGKGLEIVSPQSPYLNMFSTSFFCYLAIQFLLASVGLVSISKLICFMGVSSSFILTHFLCVGKPYLSEAKWQIQ